MARVGVFIEGVKIDTFKDETIELNSSIANTDNIDALNTDYTKSFTVPASINNNRFFKHWYDQEIDNGFDARTRKKGHIELDGFPFRYGKWTLSKSKLKNGRVSSYTINFTGNLVNLKDVLGNMYLSDLDLSEYNFDYTSDNVKTGLTTSLFGGDLIYSLFARKQYYYKTGASDFSGTNIAYNNASSTNGVGWQEATPSLKLNSIIRLIEETSGFNFSNDFFGSSEFTNLYLALIPEKKKESDIATFAQKINFDSGDTTYFNLSTDTGSFTVIFTLTILWLRHRLTIVPALASQTTPYKIRWYVNGSLYAEEALLGTATVQKFSYDLGISLGQSYTLYFEIVAPVGFSYTAETNNQTQVQSDKITYASGNAISGVSDLSLLMPRIKIIDFLKGIFSMFKLVAVPDDNGTDIYVDTIVNYYNNANVHDVTRYISKEDLEVDRATLYNLIEFKFEDPTTILNKQFKALNNIAYGDLRAQLEDEFGKPLDGGALEIKLPFEQIVYERLIDLSDDSQTAVQYGALINEKFEAVTPKPHIHYNKNIAIGSKTIGFINDNSVKELLNTTLNVPTHTLGLVNPQFSTVWGREINEYTSEFIQNTLYTNYYDDYITSIFNIRRRNFTYNGVFPIHLLTKIQLNDVLKIHDSYFRINDFTVNLLNNVINLKLFNAFDTTLNTFVANVSSIVEDYTEHSYNLSINSTDIGSISFSDLGFGTSWLSYSVSGSIVTINFAENQTEDDRNSLITINNTSNTKSIEVSILQLGLSNTFDSSITTFDLNTLTFDSE